VTSAACEPTFIPGVFVVRRRVFGDSRGWFEETFRASDDCVPPGVVFVQDNHSHSSCGVLRGLHYQLRRPQAKLVTVTTGVIYDVALDVRRGSPTFGRWFGLRMEAGRGVQIFVPAGIAHGFCVLSETADVVYKCSDYYDPADERGVLWSDPHVAVKWPVAAPVVSEKDGRLPALGDVGDADLPEWKEP